MPTGPLQILHQSPGTVPLERDSKAVPLYCIASKHSQQYEYEWSKSGLQVGYNSSILWINRPGLYRCKVRHYISTEECVSKLIRVRKEGKHTLSKHDSCDYYLNANSSINDNIDYQWIKGIAVMLSWLVKGRKHQIPTTNKQEQATWGTPFTITHVHTRLCILKHLWIIIITIYYVID